MNHKSIHQLDPVPPQQKLWQGCGLEQWKALKIKIAIKQMTPQKRPLVSIGTYLVGEISHTVRNTGVVYRREERSV